MIYGMIRLAVIALFSFALHGCRGNIDFKATCDNVNLTIRNTTDSKLLSPSIRINDRYRYDLPDGVIEPKGAITGHLADFKDEQGNRFNPATTKVHLVCLIASVNQNGDQRSEYCLPPDL